MKKNAKARKTFDNFGPTNHREYVEWVGDARREETRNERLKASSYGWRQETATSKAGQARWNNAETHAVENVGKTETHALDI